MIDEEGNSYCTVKVQKEQEGQLVIDGLIAYIMLNLLKRPPQKCARG